MMMIRLCCTGTTDIPMRHWMTCLGYNAAAATVEDLAIGPAVIVGYLHSALYVPFKAMCVCVCVQIKLISAAAPVHDMQVEPAADQGRSDCLHQNTY